MAKTTGYIVLTVPGIGEQSGELPQGMLANLTRALPRRFVSHQHNWHNTYGPVPVWDGASYARNVEAAVTALTNAVNAYLRNTHYAVILVGYSGGAHVASMALTRLAAQGRTSRELPAAVMVSNPSRRLGDSAGPPSRWGITGQHGSFPQGMKLFDVSNPVDVICNCPAPPFPLRGFSDLSGHFSLADPVSWGRQLLETAQRGQLQNAWRLSSLSAWWDATALGRGYLFDGQHTTWYVPRLPAVAAQLDAWLP